MKNTNKIIAMVFVLVFMFTVVMSSAVFAAPGNDKANGKDNAIETEKVKGSDKANEPDREEKTKVKETEENNTAETDDSTVETDESTVEEEKAVKEKDKVMEQKKVLMKQLIEVRKSGDTEAEAQLLAQVNEYKEQLRLMVRNRYTEEEMAQLEQAACRNDHIKGQKPKAGYTSGYKGREGISAYKDFLTGLWSRSPVGSRRACYYYNQRRY